METHDQTTISSRTNVRRGRILLSILLVLGICGVSIVGIEVASCAIEIPNYSISQSLGSFVSDKQYTIDDLVIMAREEVQRRLSFVDTAETELVNATFACTNSSCQLDYARIDVYVMRSIRCLFEGPRFSLEMPFARSVSWFTFDIANNLATAHTGRSPFVPFSLRWEELPTSIDEIIELAISAVGEAYTLEHEHFSLRIGQMSNHWIVSFHVDSEAPADITLSISYEGTLITDSS